VLPAPKAAEQPFTLNPAAQLQALRTAISKLMLWVAVALVPCAPSASFDKPAVHPLTQLIPEVLVLRRERPSAQRLGLRVW